jgi:arylsulfatase A-like enzyme
VTSSICCVSRAGILSGQYATRHGVRDFDTPIAAPTLANIYPFLFRSAGYSAGFIGKWGLTTSHPGKVAKVAGQFDYWAGFMQQGNYWHDQSCQYVRHNGRDRSDNSCTCSASGRRGKRTEEGLAEPLHLTTTILPDKVIEFLDTRDPLRPFCLSVSFKAPHEPFSDWAPAYGDLHQGQAMPVAKTATPEAAAGVPPFLKESRSFLSASTWTDKASPDSKLQSDIRDYYRLVACLDRAVERIVKALEERRLLESTVIVFSSDNGLFLGEHGFSGKWRMHEESIRVPLIVCDPRMESSERGRACDEMVLNIDIAPTLLDLADLEAPRAMQGKSLVALLRNPDLELREDWFYEFPYRRELVRCEGVRGRRWKYMRYVDQRPVHEALYDLASDPGEGQNLAAMPEHAEILRSLRARYFELQAACE